MCFILGEPDIPLQRIKMAELSGGVVGFGKMKADVDFTVDGYALAVCNEIRQAIKGLVER